MENDFENRTLFWNIFLDLEEVFAGCPILLRLYSHDLCHNHIEHIELIN